MENEVEEERPVSPNAGLRPRGSRRSRSTLLLHVPKTGGSSVEALLADHYERKQSHRAGQHQFENVSWPALNDPSKLFVSGHFPHTYVAERAFDTRVTILRNPLDVLESLIAYTRRIGRQHGEIERALATGGRYRIYAPYFSPASDYRLYELERGFGLATGFEAYAGEADLPGALAVLDGFDHVLAFERLDEQMAMLIQAENLFPPSVLPHRRSHARERSSAEAAALLCKEDMAFYEAARQRFVRIGGMADYALYRHRYARDNGLQLARNDGGTLDLTGPVGSGWSYPEGTAVRTFRWSDGPRCTVDVPVANGGTYMARLYFQNPIGVEWRASACVQGLDEVPVPLARSSRDELTVLAGRFACGEPSWMTFRLQVEPASERTDDERELGLILAVLHVFRVS